MVVLFRFDDWWDETKLNIVYKKIIKTEADVIVHNEFLFIEKNKKKKIKLWSF